MNLEFLPSLRNLARMLLKEGEAGQVVLFSYPLERDFITWRQYIIDAMNTVLAEQGKDRFWETLKTTPSAADPKADIVNHLNLDKDCGIEEILRNYGDAAPLVIELSCAGKELGSWHRFIHQMAKYLRVMDSGDTTRVVCIFIIAPFSYPPLEVDTGLRSYGFWNPLQWEEVRLFIGNQFEMDENPIQRAWKISTYTGAANANPNLLRRLLKSSPTSLSDIKNEISVNISQQEQQDFSHTFSWKQSWGIPTGDRKQWLEGKVQGCTLDRGRLIPWEALTKSDFDQMFERAIWREQVAGLLPLLLEVTLFTSEIVTKVVGERWKKELVNGGNLSQTEPKDILTIFKDKSYGTLPYDLKDLLHKLRMARNKLAHLEPLECQEVMRLWKIYDRLAKNYES